jgi:hypothetical protein
MNRKDINKCLCLLPILLLLHGCINLAHVKIKPISPESANSSINVSAESSIKAKILEIVHQVAEKYGFQKTAPKLLVGLFNGSILVTYRRELLFEVSVHQLSPNSFRIDLSEDLRITQSVMSKQIQADLVDKLSESLGKEYIITQSAFP